MSGPNKEVVVMCLPVKMSPPEVQIGWYCVCQSECEHQRNRLWVVLCLPVKLLEPKVEIGWYLVCQNKCQSQGNRLG